MLSGPMFQTGKAFEHIDKLSYEIGPRLAGSRGERMAIDYIKQQFVEMGLKPELLQFSFVSRWLKRKVIAVTLSAAFVLSLFLQPLATLAVWVGACCSWFILDFLLPKQRSQDIIVRIGGGDSKRKVALMAHVDTPPCGKRLLPAVRILAVFLTASFFFLLVLRHFHGGPWEIACGLFAPAIFPVLAAVFNSGRIRRISPGANDNAAGVAIVVEAARACKESPISGEVFFVLTGAEEEGLKGAEALVRSGLISKDALILNLDGVGFGSQLYVIEGNGLIFPTKTPENINKILVAVAERAGVKPRYWWAPLTRHDHLPFVRAGYEATTLTFDTPAERTWKYSRFFRLKNARTREYPYIHRMEDLPEKLEPKTVELAGKLALEFLRSASGVVSAGQ